VDAQTCKLIVLDQRIQSMTKFKQIIGRGTRINEDYGKYYFTILDFKKATELFADPAFDGDPVVIYEPGEGDTVVPPDEGGEEDPTGGGEVIDPTWPDEGGDEGGGGGNGRRRYVVSGVPVMVVSERVQYYGADGKLITESLRDYTRKKVTREFASLDEFLRTWGAAEKKEAVIRELEERGVMFDALAEEVGREYDAFDLVCHVVFGQPPLTRRERVEQVRKRDYFTRYGVEARAVLDALLDKYAAEGIESVENLKVLRVQPFSEMGTAPEIIRCFGSKEKYLEALHELEHALYPSPAA
jgi:type I restriction enzyme R subunit